MRAVPVKRQHVQRVESTQSDYTRLSGGIDQVSPPITIPPGAALSAHNYESGTLGSYQRIDGFEHYSGKTSPSAGTYLYCTVTAIGTTAVGDTITGATSGATGKVVAVSAGVIAITKVTGTFNSSSENFTVSAVVQGAMTSIPLARGYPTGLEDATTLNLVADEYRADIAAPTGTGSIRGLALLRGVLYSFVDKDATNGFIYKATASGWSVIPMYYTLSFTGGNLAIADGVTVTQLVTGATGVVKRHVLDSGSYDGGSAVGRFILTTIAGTFDATNAIQTSGVTRATASSLLTQIAILKGGRYEVVQYNFAGSTDTIRMYGCDGVNKAFEFDGDVYIPINTGMTTDTPLHIAAHKQMLHLTFISSLQSSTINYPFQWSAVTGANEIGMGDDISGMLTQPGDVLAIATRNSTKQLQGSSVQTFFLAELTPEVGAIPYSMQNLGVAYWVDDRGVIRIDRTQAYGNFDNATVSRKVQPLIDAMRKVLIASTVYKSRNQVRFYGTDGTGIIMTVVDGRNGSEHHFTSFTYPVNVSCAVSGEDSTGKDVIFFGATDGKVYQADRGSSFNGAEIESFVRLPFNHSKSPSTIKRYRKCILEATAVGYSVIRMHPDMSYGDPGIAQHLVQSTAIQGLGGIFDVSYYEAAYYDSRTISSPEIQIDGSGTNIGITLYSKSDIDLGHTLSGVTIHYTPRRLQR